MPNSTIDYQLYFDLAIYGALALGALFGLLKGFKRSVWSFATYLLLIVGFFVTIGPAVDFIWTYENPQIGTLLGQVVGSMIPAIGGATSLGDAFMIAVGSFLPQQVGDLALNVHALALLTGVGKFVFKLVYMILYFTIFWLLYKIVCAILFAIFLKGRNKDSKYISKNRLLGSVFGVLEAAVGIFVMLITLSGVIDIAASVSAMIPVEEQSVALEFPRRTVYEAADSLLPIPEITIPAEVQGYVDMLQEIVAAYDANYVVQLSEQLTYDNGVDSEPLTIHLFDTVLSIDYETADDTAAQISFRHELSVFAGISGYLLNLDAFQPGGDISTLTSDDVIAVFGMLGDSDLITTLLPLGIEVAANMFDTTLEIPTEELYQLDWRDQLDQLGVIAAVGLDIVHAAGLLDPDVNLETVTVDGDLVRDLFDALADSDLVNLAIVVALEPVLEQVGDTINAIVTVPDDIVWADEFRAMGALLGAVLDTGITMADVQAGNYGALITAVANVDFTLLLDSRIITLAIINILEGAGGILQIDMLVIPDDIVWLDTLDGDGNLVPGELRNILLALNAVVQVASGIDFEQIGPSDIAVLDDATIDALFESRVLVASLSEFIATLDLGDFALVIPDDVRDADGYILKDEFKYVAKALKLAVENLSCEPGVDACPEIGFDFTKAFTLGSEDLDVLLASRILTATIGSYLLNLDVAELVIPGSALEPVRVAGEDLDVVSAAEIRNVFAAVLLLGISDFQNIAFDTSILANLEGDIPGELDEDKLDTLFASLILRATIAKVLVDMTGGADSIVVVPDLAEDGTEIFYKDPDDGTTDLLAIAELKAILRGVYALDLDFENFSLDDIGPILANIDMLLDSAILHATISSVLINLEGDMIVVPDLYGDPEMEIRKTVGGTDYIAKAELIRVFDALTLLDITSFDNVALDATIIDKFASETNPDELDEDKLDTMFDSIILQASVSKMVFDLVDSGDGGTAIVVPDADVDGNPVRYLDHGYDYLAVDEMKAILRSFFALDLTDFATISFSDLGPILDNIGVLLDSAVLHATVSKTILDLATPAPGEEATIVVPVVHGDGAEAFQVQVVVGDVTYIAKHELTNIIDALNILGIDSTENIAFDATIIDNLESTETPGTLDDNKLDTLFSSYILRATISKMLLDLTAADPGEDPLVIVPEADWDGTPVRYEDHGIDYVSVDELGNVLRALFSLDVTDFNNVASLSLANVMDHFDTLITSAILHATISDQILAIEADMIVIPEEYTRDFGLPTESTEEIVRTVGLANPVRFIRATELSAMFDAIKVLGFTDFSVSLDASIIANLQTEGDPTTLDAEKLDTLFGSAIIHASISKMFDDLTTADPGEEPLVIVPETDWDGVPVVYDDPLTALHYIAVVEIQNVLSALNSLNISDFNNVASLSLENVMAHFDELIGSAILHATISDQILAIEADMIVIPEDYTRDYGLPTETSVEIVRTVGVTTPVRLIFANELSAMFDALDLLGFTDFSVSLDATVINRLEDDADPSVLDPDKIDLLFASAIIHASFSKMFFDLTDPAPGEEALVVVPDDDVDGLPVVYNDLAVDYVSVPELGHTLAALHALNVTDFDAVDALDMDTIIAQLDTLLASAIMHATISKQILGIDLLVIPFVAADGSTVVRLTVSGIEFIARDEIGSLFDGLHELGISGDLSQFSGDVDYSAFFDDAKRATILTSAIMHAMISDTLVNFDPATLTVPFYAETGSTPADLVRITVGDPGATTEYVVLTEIDAFFVGLKTLGITGNIEDFDGTLDLEALFDDVERPLVLASSILQARISKEFFNLGEDVIAVPHVAEDGVTAIRATVGVDETATEYILQSELDAIFTALPLLGFSGDIQEFGGTVVLTALFDADQRATILASATLQARISSELLDLGDETLAIPYANDEYDPLDPSTLIRVTVGDIGATTEYVTATELGRMFDALHLLGFDGDIQNFTGTIDTTALFDAGTRPTVLASAIVHAKISHEIIGLGAGTLAVPYTGVDGSTTIRLSVGPLGFTTEFITKDELGNLFDAMELLGFTDDILGAGFTGDFDLTALFDDGTRPTVLASAIIHAKISAELVGLDAGVLVVPYGTEDFDELVPSTYIRVTVGDVGMTTEYIVAAELDHLFQGLSLLGFTGNVTTFDGDIDLSAFYDPAQRAIVLASAILQAKISTEMFNLGSSTMLVPNQDVDGNVVRLLAGPVGLQTDYITKAELDALFEALHVLGLSGDANFAGTVNLNNVDTEEKQTVLFTSAIMHATISQTVLGLSDDGILIVPAYTQDGTADVDRIRLLTDGIDFIATTELKALINALLAMDYGDLSIAAAIDTSKFFTETATILASASMQATISAEVLKWDDGGLDDALVVPAYTVDGVADAFAIRRTVSGTDFIDRDELTLFFAALDKMGFSDLDSFAGGIDSGLFFAEKDTILLSAIMHATISDQILHSVGGVLLVPNEDVENGGLALRVTVAATEYITVAEIKALFDALDELGLDDFGTDITLAAIFTADYDILLASATMQATIADSLLASPTRAEDDPFDPNTESSNLVVPNEFRQAITVGVDAYTQIEHDELLALLDGLNKLGVANFGSGVSGNATSGFDYAMLMDILESASLHVTMHNMIQVNFGTDIPDLAKEVSLYGVDDLTKAEEIARFIVAVNTLGEADFTDATFSIAAILSLTEEQRGAVMDSMIVRNILTDDIETAVAIINAGNIPLGPFYTFENSDYMEDNPALFLTKQGALDAIDFIDAETM